MRDRVNTALTIAAEGGKADIVKPLKGLWAGCPCQREFRLAWAHLPP